MSHESPRGSRVTFRAGLGIVPSQRTPQAPAPATTSVFSAQISEDAQSPRDRSAGYAAGFAAGWAAGARQAAAAADVVAEQVAARRHAEEEQRRAAVEQVMRLLDDAVAGARTRTAPVLAAAERAMVDAAMQLAEAIIGAELSDAPTSARAAIARVMAQPLAEDVTTIRLSQRDLAVVRAEGFGDLPAGIELVADPTLAPGDVVAAHPDGFIDGRIAAALQRAKEAVAGEVTA